MSDELPDHDLPELTPLELNRVAPLDEASHLSSLSVDTLREQYADKILQLSPKRYGMRVGHALQLNGGWKTQKK